MRRALLLASLAFTTLAAGPAAAATAQVPSPSPGARTPSPAARPVSTPTSNPVGRSSGAQPVARVTPATGSLRGSATTLGAGLLSSLDAPGVDAEPVQLRTQDNLRLSASFFPARGSRREVRAPGAILVHDAGRSRTDLARLATALQRRGFAVLTLDLRGHGDSRTEEVSFTPEDEGAAERLWAFTLRDLETAAAYLRSRDDVHSANLSMIGVGAGAAIAARHAVRDGNARAVVLVAPRELSLGFNLLTDVKDLGGLPTLILAERDGKSGADRLAQAGNQAEGFQYIDVSVLRSNGKDMLDDRRLPAEITRHLQENVATRR